MLMLVRIQELLESVLIPKVNAFVQEHDQLVSNFKKVTLDRRVKDTRAMLKRPYFWQISKHQVYTQSDYQAFTSQQNRVKSSLHR
jgi:hypothetical protein